MRKSRLAAANYTDQEPSYIKIIKKGIWLYYLLLIFEGALRKWVLPGLATPLLIVRDPVAFVLILYGTRHNLLKLNGYLMAVTVIGVLSFILAMLVGHGNLAVALYGTRILLLHFPLIFLIQKVFTEKDVTKLGIVTLWIAIPMAILIAMQFYSPQTAWVNRGIGGDEEGAGFSGALGFFRPPGTFSFTNGNTLFFGFVAVFVFYFWLTPGKINKLILIGASIGLLMSIPLSISRGLFFQIGITVIFSAIVILKKPKYIGQVLFTAFALILIFVVLSKASFFQIATGAFTSRFEVANKSEGGVESVLLDRYLGGLWSALSLSFDKPFFGIGIGAGTNVGSNLLTGQQQFLGGEGEWGRLVAELGPILGIIIIFIRMGMSVEVAVGSYKHLVKGDILPWMLLSFGLLTLPQGGWAQPTSLGFCTITGGLMFASLNKSMPYKKGGITKRVISVSPNASRQV